VNLTTGQTAYRADDGTMVQTFAASPSGAGPHPALVLCYEFWGMLEIPAGGPHMRDVARRFAAAGYVAVVPDYYAARGQQPTMEGGTIVGAPSDEQSGSDLCAAVHWLQLADNVDPTRVGTIGWCGGGRQALFLAAKCSGIAAAASFYGRIVNRATQPGPSPLDLAASFPCPIFGAYGEADKGIAVDTVRSFDEELTKHGKPHEIHVFPGAEHAFMNDRRPEGYNPQAAADAWRLVVDFFGRTLT
jgi:carboxymethylenebutenolidase